MTAKPIVLIKIGGSLITDKKKKFSLKEENLNLVCQEIKKATTFKKLLIIGHGSGSFAHFPAKKYKTHLGVVNNKSIEGIAEVADAAARLNRIVVKKLLNYKVNAVTISPSSMMTTRNHKPKSVFLESLEKLLFLNLLPVVYGDQVFDIKKGCTIFSTERVLGFLAVSLQKKGYFIEKIIHCGTTQGVYDKKGKTIPLLSNKNFVKYKKSFKGSNGIDITGGMIHKVEETLLLAKRGIPGFVICGCQKNNLSKAVAGKKVNGTKIIWI